MVFVTGGTGLVGSHLLFDLILNGYKVRAGCRTGSNIDGVKRVFSYYSPDYEALFSQIEWVVADVCDPFAIRRAMKDCKQVYHCAAVISFAPSDRKKLFRVNAEGTAVMVDAALEAGIQKFCFVSSVGALGSAEPPLEIDEETLRNNSNDYSGYALSKFKGELEVWRAAVEGLKVVIVNPSVIVGPWDWHLGLGKLFSLVARNMPFYPTGTTGFVDVRDVSAIMIQLMEKNIDNQSFCLNSENLQHREILNMVARSLGKPPLKIPLSRAVLSITWRLEWLRSRLIRQEPLLTRESARSSANNSLFSNRKIKAELNYNFIPVSESIQSLAKIYRQEHP